MGQRGQESFQTCNKCQESKPLSCFSKVVENKNTYYRKTCKKCRTQAIAQGRIQLTPEQAAELRDLEKDAKLLDLLLLSFRVTDRPTKENIEELIVNSRTLLAIFVKYKIFVRSIVGVKIADDGGLNDYHSVADEEFGSIEAPEKNY